MAKTKQNNRGKRHWWQRLSFKKLNKRYVFLMSHEETMEPIVDFRVNLMNIVIIAIASVVVLIALTTVLIAFTPLREYIPGYTDTALQREVYTLSRRADSIEAAMHRKDLYFENLKRIVEGYETEDDRLHSDPHAPMAPFDVDTIELRKSVADSLLRAAFEQGQKGQPTHP